MKHPFENQPQEVLAGIVERVTYHNAENGFCVLRAKARGHRDVVTVVGHAATIAAGEWITASGEWVNDRTHGQQFKARFRALHSGDPLSPCSLLKASSCSLVAVGIIIEVKNLTERWIVSAPTLFDDQTANSRRVAALISDAS
jgi:hypothetical protein